MAARSTPAREGAEPTSPPPTTGSLEPDWLTQLEEERRYEQRLLWMNMAYSAAFHTLLIVILLIFVTSPQGQSEGLTEIQLSAEVPRLGDPDAPDAPGEHADADGQTPRPAEHRQQDEDMALAERERELSRALDAVAAAQDQKLAEQREASAAAAKAAEARRIKGIRSADAKVGGNLSGRAGIGGLEPRTFYGLKVHSRKMVFILDISGSMNIPYAKLNLRNAYRTLGEKEKFAIVCYDNRIFFWPESKRLVNATGANKDRADAWVAALQGGGGTNIYDALKTGFEISHGGESADTFYFLSDGYPTYGVKDPGLIIAAARKWNRRQAVLVNTIGLGSHDRRLMATLAEDHRGKYKALR